MNRKTNAFSIIRFQSILKDNPMKIKSVLASVKATITVALNKARSFFKTKTQQVVCSRAVFKLRVIASVSKYVAIVTAIFLAIYGLPFYYMVVATSGLFCFVSCVLYVGYARYVTGVIKLVLIEFAQHTQMNHPIKDVQQPQMITVN